MSTIDRSIEQRLADLFAAEVPARAPERLADAVLARTSPRRPRPRWLTLLKETPMRLDHRPAFGSALLRTAAILVLSLLLALLALGTVVAGASLLPRPTGLIPPERGVFTPTGSMAAARNSATATLLHDGRVLVVGGTDIAGRELASAEIWDPISGLFSPTGSLAHSRTGHAAILLQDGRVLVLGGLGGIGGDAASAEVWDPDTMTFSPAGSLAVARSGARAQLLPDGRVLVTGGSTEDADGNFVTVSTAEVWDPRSNTFGPAGAMPGASDPSGTLLADGRILVLTSSGGNGDGTGNGDASASIWDPATGSSNPTGPLARGLGSGTATLLSDGRVLVAGGGWGVKSLCFQGSPRPDGTCGGGGGGGGFQPIVAAEIWDPATDAFSPTGSLGVARSSSAMTLLPDGRVLVVGGDGVGSAEVFQLK